MLQKCIDRRTSTRHMSLAAVACMTTAATGAIECDLIPNGSFTSSDDGWVFDIDELIDGDASGSMTIGLYDGTTYSSLGGDSPFDSNVLGFELVVSAGIAGSAGTASLSGTATTTVTATERFLRLERGGGFEFLFLGGSVHDLSATVTVESIRGESITGVIYASTPSEPTPDCGLGLSVLGTFDADPNVFYLDLEEVGIEVGETVTVTIAVAGDAITSVGCQASQVFAFLIVDNFSFCDGAPCEGDLDFNGEIGFNDLLLLLSDWGGCPNCPSDLDGDWQVGFSDLLLLLNGWGPCQ